MGLRLHHRLGMSTPDFVICSLLLGPEGSGAWCTASAVPAWSNLEIRIMVVNDEKAACRRFVVHGFFQFGKIGILFISSE